jgi:rod shape-determining protein MreC
VAVLAIALMMVDINLPEFKSVRSFANLIIGPIYRLADIPALITDLGNSSVRSRQEIIDENERLKSEVTVLSGRAQRMAALVAENGRLRALLNSTALVADDDLVIAEIIGVSPQLDKHHIILNKGSQAGVYEGQPVLDADGLMGQVLEVGPFTSRVILITDQSHAVPAQLSRNGMRVVVEGIGDYSTVILSYVALTADVQVGDLLVSSGLGGRFPAGYPVATVYEVERIDGSAFLTVKAQPEAKLNRSRHVLLVFDDQSVSVGGKAPVTSKSISELMDDADAPE